MANLSVAVIIPTKGRPAVLAETLASVARQEFAPAQVIVSASCREDLPEVLPEWVEVVLGPAGSCVQRNTAKSRLRADTALVLLLDDDVELASYYLHRVVEAFRAEPELGLVGGRVVAEGVGRAEARNLLERSAENETVKESPRKIRALYGCNMCVRAEVFRQVDFDENLRLVGWLEDFDWSVRAGRLGSSLYLPSAPLVHLKTSAGRTSGRRFGYAQVVNPYYLHRKGIIPGFREVFERHWARCVASNIAGALRRDPQIDRWGRLIGNAKGFADIFTGTTDPRRIELM